MPLQSVTSQLPSTPNPKANPKAAPTGEYDLSSALAGGWKPSPFWNALLIGAFLAGLACVATLAYAFYTSSFNTNNGQLLVQATITGYLTGCLALYAYRIDSDPTTRLQVMEDGLTITRRSGRVVNISWRQLAGQAELYDLRANRPTSWVSGLQLVDSPTYKLLHVSTFRQPQVTRTYLTPPAFDGIVEGSRRAGLRATQYGTRVTIEQANTMANF